MRRLIALLLISLFHPSLAQGQSVQNLCLDATTSGDAIINCQKAMYLVQQRQLEVIVDMHNKVLLNIARSSSRTAASVASVIERLEALEASLAKQAENARTSLYLSDLSNFSERTVKCVRRNDCENEIVLAVDAICQRLGFAGHNAYEATPLEQEPGAQIQWLVCR